MKFTAITSPSQWNCAGTWTTMCSSKEIPNIQVFNYANTNEHIYRKLTLVSIHFRATNLSTTRRLFGVYDDVFSLCLRSTALCFALRMLWHCKTIYSKCVRFGHWLTIRIYRFCAIVKFLNGASIVFSSSHHNCIVVWHYACITSHHTDVAVVVVVVVVRRHHSQFVLGVSQKSHISRTLDRYRVDIEW